MRLLEIKVGGTVRDSEIFIQENSWPGAPLYIGTSVQNAFLRSETLSERKGQQEQVEEMLS